jgi:tetratricopeptide (TPR) repeat protein
MLSYDSAYFYYHRAFQVDSTKLSFRTSMATMMYMMGRIREGIEIYEKILEEFQPGDRHMADLANLYSIRKEYAKSLAIYKGLLEKDSMNHYYAKQAGKNYLDMNEMDSAIYYYERAFDLNPRDVFLANRLGNLHFLKQDLPTAIARVSTGLAFDSANLDLLRFRGYLFLHAGQNPLAIHDLEKAWIRDTLDVFTNKYLGMSYHEEKIFTAARAVLLLAFTQDSTDAETAFFLGNACRWSRYEKEGEKYYLKAIELRQPDSVKIKSVYIQLAELYKVLHRFDEAFDAYDKALAYTPNDITIYFQIGQAYDRNLNQKETALAYYEKYLAGLEELKGRMTIEGAALKAMEEHVRNRINRIKEELFFENPLP